MNDPSQYHPAEDDVLVKLTSLLVLGAGLLALFTGQDWFWLVFALGFAVLVPIVKLVTDELGSESDDSGPPTTDLDRGHDDASESKQDALDTLRNRYARGELSEEAFERKVERLLETETLEGARGHVERESAEAEADLHRETDDAR
jgi:hypothetical protein